MEQLDSLHLKIQACSKETFEKFTKWVAEPKLIVDPKLTLASIDKSPQFIGKKPGDRRTGTVCVPTMEVLKAKSIEEIRALKLCKLGWFSCNPYLYVL